MKYSGVLICLLGVLVAGCKASNDSLQPADFVKASAFGWNATNATKCLQAAFDSGAAKVVIDRQAGSGTRSVGVGEVESLPRRSATRAR